MSRGCHPGGRKGDLTRLASPRALMKCMGLMPSDHASGAQRRPGSLTKAGTPPARRALGEGAWAYRAPAQVSRPLQLRRATHPTIIQDIRWQAPGRRWKPSRRLGARGTQAKGVTVAMARALPGVLWALAQEVPRAVEAPDASCGHAALSTVQRGKVLQRASAETQPRCGGILGGVRRLVEDTRAESEAGPRRTHGRGYPTHG